MKRLFSALLGLTLLSALLPGSLLPEARTPRFPAPS